MSYNTDAKIKNDNRDPITGEPGSHPVGTGVGGVVGMAAGVAGAAAIGAAYGTVIGPAGAAAGAAVGAIVGGLTGHGIAEGINPTAEDTYWSENYTSRPYVDGSQDYSYYGSAYRHGVNAFTKNEGKRFEEIEMQASKDWENESEPRITWDQAKPATRDAYNRLYNNRTNSEM